MKRKLFRIAITLITLIAIAGFVMVTYNLTNSSKTNKGNGAISLVPPAFAQTAQVSTFPAETAGICAYANVGKSIKFEKLEFSPIFERIEEKGQDYLIGVVKIENLWTNAFPYVYVSSDGWIAAYYPVNVSSTMIINWANYKGEAVPETTFHNAMAKVLSELGLGPQEVGYYHFGYPEATKIFLGIKDIGHGEEEKFSYTIPSDVKIYESSYSAKNPYGSIMYVHIDGTPVIDIGAGNSENGFIPKEYLTPEQQHTVAVKYGGQFALAFVYGAK